MPDQSVLNRREFLKLLTAGAALSVSHRWLPILASECDGDDFVPPLPEYIPVPPSLMLHSRHRWRFPAMLEYLAEAGFTGITYADLNRAILGEIRLPDKSILISIDDLSPFQGNPSYEYFAAMKDTLVEYGFKGTFSVITRPDQLPDEARWEEVIGWIEAGIALETHTAFHSYLDNPNFTARDYEAEIIESAQFITARSGVAVCALITPYGSGYNPETGEINPQVAAACREADIRFVVGIAGGRTPISTAITTDTVVCLGRVGPGLTNDADGALYEMEHW